MNQVNRNVNEDEFFKKEWISMYPWIKNDPSGIITLVENRGYTVAEKMVNTPST